ncbi:hypothetical protein [Rhizobium leguminosarum]|uniref:hypothetical protein n=1 Tax=Rhizobium leguminosarum TaxID=384 RepID=UPI003CFBF9CE
MNWRNDEYRSVLQIGDVDVGAIYPPIGRGHLWRWRIWVTVSGHPSSGRDRNEAQAKTHVERRFRAFLNAAGLVPAGGDA